MIPFAAYAPDQAALDPNSAPSVRNVLPLTGAGYGPVPAPVAYSGGLVMPGDVRTGYSASDDAGNRLTYGGAARNTAALYQLTATSWVDRSRVSPAYTGGRYWQFLPWENTLIATNFEDWPQVINFGGANFADLTNDVRFAVMAEIRGHLVVGDTWDPTDGNQPHRLRWSAQGDPSDWAIDSVTQADISKLRTGGRVQAVVSGDYGVVVQERTTRRLTYTGGPAVFQLDETLPGVGTEAPRSVCSEGHLVFMLALDGFVMLDQGTRKTPIGEGTVDTTFRREVDTAAIDLVQGVVSPITQTVYWLWPGPGHAPGVCNRVSAYNYVAQRWSEIETELESAYWFAGPAWTLEDFDAVYPGGLETIPGSFDDPVYAGTGYSLAGFGADGRLLTFTGPSLAAEIETAEAQIAEDGTRTHLRGVRPMVSERGRGGSAQQAGATIRTSVLSRRHIDAPLVESVATERGESGICRHRVNARYLRAKVQIDAGYVWDRALGVEPFGVRSGRR